MSTFYAIDVKLKAKFIYKNVEYILQRGSILGLTYFGENLTNNLSVKQTADTIFSKDSYYNEEDTYHMISVKFEDAYFQLYIISVNELYMKVNISDFCPKWVKDFEGFYAIDFARYIRLLLKLLDDFVILKLKTEAI